MKKYIRGLFVTIISVVVAFIAIAGVAHAATTISTDISTGGTLTVAGITTLNGASVFAGNATTTGQFHFAGTGSTTASNGINLLGGCFAIGGTCLTSGSGGSQTPWTSNIFANSFSLSGVGSFDATSSVVTNATSTNLFTTNAKVNTLTLTNPLSPQYGGTGLNSLTNGTLLVGGPSNTVAQIATSSLGLITTNIIEGANLYFTNPRAQLAVSGLYAATTTANTWSATQTFNNGILVTGVTYVTATGTNATTTNLDVMGQFRATGATSTFTTGIRATCFSVDGITCLTSGSGGSQTPWTSNINGALFSLSNMGSLSATSSQVTQATTSIFAVTGQFVNSGIATSTFANGIQLSAGCFRDSSGSCISAGSGTAAGGTGAVQFANAGFAGDSANFKWDNVNNRLGIGTSSPYATLSVAGPIVGTYFTGTANATSTFGGGLAVVGNLVTSSTATSTFAGGVNLSTGCFAVGGVCISSASGTSSISLSTVNTWTAQQRFPDIQVTAGNYGVDTETSGMLNLGTINATNITFGKLSTNYYFPGTVNASTTSVGNVLTSGTVIVGGNATTTSAGNISTLGTLTLANSSTAINGIVFGACTIGSPTTIPPQTSKNFGCTTGEAINASNRVFMQSAGTLPTGLFIEAASSTSSGVIGLAIYNASTTAAVSPGAVNINFLGIK